ncbi:MAG: hypothetical protein DRR08_19960 [Candidatus Parabeggiatoa sp. nov. 2]|nr:MAG: hypothetical protein B6247_09190 [Beggiatoa sp. 4572_84]RKZ57085.1 MAG: hypothetical protein DRR08_19960 [Gammaproteobacteria bacterium]
MTKKKEAGADISAFPHLGVALFYNLAQSQVVTLAILISHAPKGLAGRGVALGYIILNKTESFVISSRLGLTP